MPYLSSGGSDVVSALQSSTTTLESRLGATEERIDPIDARVSEVEGALKAGDGLASRIDGLEAQIAALDGAPASGGADGSVDDRLAAMEQRLEDLAGEFRAADETLTSSTEALSNLQTALPSLEETLAATGKTVEETGAQTATLGQSVETLTQSFETLGSDVQTLSDKVGETEAVLAHLGGEYQRGAAMIVAIGDVDRAITRAEPFETSLLSLKSLVRDEGVLSDTLATLEPMAANGVPGLGDLKGSFGAMSSRVLLAADGDRSLTDRVGDNLFGIINMRPAGAEVEGENSRAVLSRAQAKLSADNLGGAVDELSVLEGAAGEAAAAWVEQGKGRLAAEAAVVDLRAHAQGLVAKGS